MDWTILGIEPTEDKKAITAAYRARLRHVNPEDKPEQFKALRAAYEQALELCGKAAQPEERDESPLGLWLERLRLLYMDFPARISVESWQELMSEDICLSLDSRPLVEDALLRFLMEDFYIPQAVWQYLDSVFDWQSRRAELCESYPRDFIDYAVINGIRLAGSPPYELFTPGLDGAACDNYRRIYYRANQLSGQELERELEQLFSLSERHPYGELLSYRLLLEKGQTEQALAGYKSLAERYPEDVKLCLEWTARCIAIEDYSQGEIYARRALELSPAHNQARHMLADCLAGQGNYEDAKKEIFTLMNAAGGDQKRIYELGGIIRDWNGKIMDALEAQVKAEPQNMELKSRLAWCCLQNDRNQQALELCRALDDSYTDRYDYHNLYAKTYYALSMYEEAIEHLKAAEEIIRHMEPDGTEKTDRRIDTLPNKIQMQGSCLMALKRQDEAIALFRRACELSPEDPELVTNLGRALAAGDKSAEAAACFEKLIRLMPGSYHGYYLLAQSMYDLRRDRDAFDAVNRALELEGSDLGVYVLKMRILLRNAVWEQVRETLDYLREHGVTDAIEVVWCEAQLLEFGEGEKEKALELYRSLAERIQGGESFRKDASVYYRLLVLEGEKLDAGKPEDRAVMLELAEKGLALDENDFALLDYKAWLLKRDGQSDKALEIYHRLEKEPRRTLDVERELAELYYDDLNTNAQKALDYYRMLIENDEQWTWHFYAGTCCKYLGDYESSERHFLRVQELNPDGIDGYNGMSYLYDSMGRWEDSLRQTEKVTEIARRLEGDRSRFFRHKVRVLRRLGRPGEAAAAVDELTGLYGNAGCLRDKFEIYCQFGLWKEAAELLKQMKRRRLQNMADYLASKVDLLIYTGHYSRARQAKLDACGLSEADDERFQLLFAEMSMNVPGQMRIWEKRMKGQQNQTHELTNIAQLQWWSGNYKESRDYAARALRQLDELIPRNRLYEALYRCRRVIVLAILGREDEARRELEHIRRLPLCENCDYCACKDADIFEANMEEVLGNYERAIELHRAGLQRFPDEMDFAVGLLRCKKRGKKK